MPKEILSEHTSSGWTERYQKLILPGKVFQLDGKTPAQNSIIYSGILTIVVCILLIHKRRHKQKNTVIKRVGKA